MLKSLDMLIGFALVMLVASAAVTMLTQLVIAALNSRGSALRNGLAALLGQAHAEWKAHAAGLSEAVLRHPLVATGSGRLGSVVRREELVKVLLELADQGAPAVRDPLRKTLAQYGIQDPGATLRAIRERVALLEAARPELATHVRETMALVENASNELVQRLTGWFDSTMDRVTHAFQSHTRTVTAVFALLVAMGVQLDAVGLLNRLAMDDELRRTLVTQAQTADQQVESLRQIAASPLVIQPEGWLELWDWGKLPGILLSAILISLGAPLWFDALKNLLRLRPALAGKEEVERTERRSSQAGVRQ